jgi:hypothetical protein
VFWGLQAIIEDLIHGFNTRFYFYASESTCDLKAEEDLSTENQA